MTPESQAAIYVAEHLIEDGADTRIWSKVSEAEVLAIWLFMGLKG
jgi:hypothetical protein